MLSIKISGSRKIYSDLKLPNPDPPKAENQKKKLITKARKDENTKKDKTNFVSSKFRGFVVKKFFHKMQRIYN